MSQDGLRLSHATVLIALAVGMIGSVGFTLHAGGRVGSPVILLVLFAGWVAFPFVVLGVAYLVSRGRSLVTELALSRAALAVSLGSLVVYGFGALVPSRPKTPLFVLVAPLSLLLIAIYVPATVVLGRRRGGEG